MAITTISSISVKPESLRMVLNCGNRCNSIDKMPLFANIKQNPFLGSGSRERNNLKIRYQSAIKA
jgi:hypothetical protein